MLGFDIKQSGVPNTIRNDSQFTRSAHSSSDRYYIGVVTTSINLYAPKFELSRKAVTNLSGHDPTQVGDTLEYTITSFNSGLDPATDIVLTDPLPPNTTYVPGSLEVVTGPNGGPKTDINADDQAEYLALMDTVRFRLGSGATGTTGGTLVPGMFTSVRFRVTVDTEAGETTLANEATIAYVAATIDAPFSHVTNRTETPVAADADLSVTKVSAPNPVAAGADLTSTIVVTNNGPNTALGVVLTDEVNPGVVPLSATPASCVVAGQTVTCALGNLTDGQSVTVTVAGRAPPGSTVTASTESRVTSATIDPDPSDNEVTVTVGVVQRATSR